MISLKSKTDDFRPDDTSTFCHSSAASPSTGIISMLKGYFFMGGGGEGRLSKLAQVKGSEVETHFLSMIGVRTSIEQMNWFVGKGSHRARSY